MKAAIAEFEFHRRGCRIGLSSDPSTVCRLRRAGRILAWLQTAKQEPTLGTIEKLAKALKVKVGSCWSR